MSAAAPSVGTPKQGHVAAGQRQPGETLPGPGEGSGSAACKQDADGRKLASGAPSGPSGSGEVQQHGRGGLADGGPLLGSEPCQGRVPQRGWRPRATLCSRRRPSRSPRAPQARTGPNPEPVQRQGRRLRQRRERGARGGAPWRRPCGRVGREVAWRASGDAARRSFAGARARRRGSPAAQPPTPKSAELAADPGQVPCLNPGASPTRARAARRVPLASMELELAPGSPIVVPSPLSDPVGSPLRRSSRFLAEATGSGSGSGLGTPHALRDSARQGLDWAASQGAPGAVRSPSAQAAAEPPHSAAAGSDGAPAAATPEPAAAPATAGRQVVNLDCHCMLSGSLAKTLQHLYLLHLLLLLEQARHAQQLWTWYTVFQLCTQSSRLPAAAAARAQAPLPRCAWCCPAAGPTTCLPARLLRRARRICHTRPRRRPWARLSQRLCRPARQGARAARQGFWQGLGQGLAARRACEMRLGARRRSRQPWWRQQKLAWTRGLMERLPCALLQTRQRARCARRHLLLRQLPRWTLGR